MRKLSLSLPEHLLNKLFLFSITTIVVVSIVITLYQMRVLTSHERKHIETLNKLYLQAFTTDPHSALLNFEGRLIEQLLNYPRTAFLCHENGSVVAFRLPDISDKVFFNSSKLTAAELEHATNTYHQLKEELEPLSIRDPYGGEWKLYYEPLEHLSSLSYFFVWIFTILLIIITVAFFLYRHSKRSATNLVWAGISRETAHQLGTPLSSIEAWIEVLKSKDIDNKIILEMEKDMQRLSLIADRFEKIGSIPELSPTPLHEIVSKSLDYIKKRSPKRVSFILNAEVEKDEKVFLNKALFEWVLENLLKNAVDAMSGMGNIVIHLYLQQNRYIVDISDQGKGIPRSKWKQVFQAGYTTKRRGWGLGLSLTKRIVEQFHHGQIAVQHSELNVGTTFRIQLPKI